MISEIDEKDIEEKFANLKKPNKFFLMLYKIRLSLFSATMLISLGVVLWGVVFYASYFVYQDNINLRAISHVIEKREKQIPKLPELYAHMVGKSLLSDFINEYRAQNDDVSLKVIEDGIVVAEASIGSDINQYFNQIVKMSHVNRNWRVELIKYCAGTECDFENDVAQRATLQFSYLDVK